MSIEKQLERIADDIHRAVNHYVGGSQIVIGDPEIVVVNESINDLPPNEDKPDFDDIPDTILVELKNDGPVQYAESWNYLDSNGKKTEKSKPILDSYPNPETDNVYIIDAGTIYQVWEEIERADGGAKVYKIIGSKNDGAFRDMYFYVKDVDKI